MAFLSMRHNNSEYRPQRNTQNATRREFLQSAAAISVGSVLPWMAPSEQALASSPLERRRFALIGVGGNGSRTAPVGQNFAELAALCDVDSTHLHRGNALLCQGAADTYRDYRDVLARDDIDIVQISTPDHWHAKIVIEAMLAGKDAYCEKPLTLTIDEGKLIRKIQSQTGRIVQVGTQQRSSFDLFNKALAIIAEGRLGKLRRILVGIGAGAWSPEIPLAKVPEGLDWDFWLGPSPNVPYRYSQNEQGGPGQTFTNGHRHFRWWYEFAGGKLTDWGAHHVDIAMLGIAAAGQNNDPVSVEGTAKHDVEFTDGAPLQRDRYNTARQFDLRVRFADPDVVMSIRHDADNGVLFEGELGRIFVNRGRLSGQPAEELSANPLPEDAVGKVYRGMPMQGNNRQAHWANFIHAIDHGVPPISDVHSHMKMLNVCHLAGICCRLGRTINWDQSTEQIIGDDLAASMMKRAYREGFEIEM